MIYEKESTIFNIRYFFKKVVFKRTGLVMKNVIYNLSSDDKEKMAKQN